MGSLFPFLHHKFPDPDIFAMHTARTGATAVTSAKSGGHDCSTAPGSHRNDINPCSSYGTTTTSTPGYDHSTSKSCQPVFATVPAQNAPGEGGCATTQHHYEPDRPHHNVVRLAHHPELAAMETASLPPDSCAADEGTNFDATTTARAGEACKQKQMNRKDDDANNIQTASVTRNDRLLRARDVVREVEEQAAALTKKKPDDEQREDNAGPLKLMHGCKYRSGSCTGSRLFH